MKNFRKLAIAAMTLMAGSARALICGGPTGTRTVDVSGATTCIASGLGSLSEPALLASSSGTSLVVERDAASGNGGILSITGVGATNGTWSITGEYTSLYMYIDLVGGGIGFSTNPDWFIVQLKDGINSGTWSSNVTGQLGLSNIAILGTSGSILVPTSTALVALGLGLLGLGFSRRRKTAA